MFDEVLNSVREQAEGVRKVLLLGADGVLVAGAGHRDPGWESLAASYADLARRTARLHGEADLPAPEEWVVSCAASSFVLRLVTAEYLLLAEIEPGGILGRARFELRKAASRLLPELES